LEGDITDNAALVFDRSDSVIFSGTISGTGTLTQSGSGTLILSGANTYTGGTTISAGTLQIGTGSTTGALEGDITDNATLVFDRSDSVIFNGTISGTGTLTQSGSGTLILSGANTYTGGTTIGTGTLQVGNGGTSGSIVGAVTDNGSLVFNRSDSVTFGGVISGTGSLTQNGRSGTLSLTGKNTYSGNTNVNAGTLFVDGSLGGGAVTVASGATLGGTGTIGGAVTIQDGGTLAPGDSVGTLTVGALTLSAGSISNYELGTPDVVGGGVNDLVIVNGNLTLAGTLNVANAGGFGSGAYRLFDYTGSLTNDGLTLNMVPAGFAPGDFLVQTTQSGQVNLLVSVSGFGTQYWDGTNTVANGTIHGGNGTWDNVTTNWTNQDATVNAPWQSQTAIFQGTAGTVTLGDNIQFNEMEFLTDGYSIVAPGAQKLIAAAVATIDVGSALSATIAAPIVDGASPSLITKTGLGTLILTGTNTYTGGTTIASGTLQIGDTGTTGSIVGAVAVIDGSTFDIVKANTAGIRAITNSQGGTTEFENGNTASSATITNGANRTDGFTKFHNTSTAGNASITNNFGGETQFSSSSSAGGATITTNNGGLTEFIDTSTGAQARLITNAGGIVDISGLSSTGTTAGSIEGSGIYALGSKTLSVGLNNLSTTVSGNLTDGGGSGGVGGALIKVGTGTLSLTGTNIYSGGTSFDRGVVAVNSDSNLGTGSLSFNGGTLEALAAGGGITSSKAVTLNAGGGTFLADANTRSTLSGTIIGPGSLTQTGGGTLILSGTNTYSGGTTIGAGATLQLGNGGTNGTIVGNVVDNGVLAFNRSNTLSFGGVISGAGSVEQSGSGTTVLSGTNTYSGGTIMNAGTLTVNNAQALGLGNVVVNGGTLGADPQAINVKGNYTQNAGGTLQLQLGGAGPGQYDSLNVSGHAALGGTLQLISLNGFQPTSTERLTLVSASGGISGKFADLLDPFSSVLALRLIYGSNTVVLGFSSDFALYALTPNERAAANLLDAIQFNPKAADLITFLDNEQPSRLPGDLAEISPDALSAFYEIGFSNANIQRLNLEGRLDDLRSGSNGFSSNMKLNSASVNLEGKGSVEEDKSAKSPVEQAMQPTPENRWGVWVTGFGDFVNVDSDYNGHGYDFTTGGVSVGVDYRITDQLAIGAMGEYAHTWTSLKPSGDIDVDSGRGGVYATWFSHGIYLNGAIYGGHNVYSSSRSTLGGMASGGTGGAEYSAFIGGGYDLHVGNLSVGPVAALQYTDVGIDSFNEHGSLAQLDIHSQSAESLRSDFGLRASYVWQVGSVLVEPSLRAAWEHEYKYSALPVTAGFAGIPGPSGTFYGPSEGHDSAILSAGVLVQWSPMIATYVNYDGQLGRDRYDSNAVTGGLRISL
jgi:fibronectin-binding autotransporter adhesin